jgi:hypothetical protein
MVFLPEFLHALMHQSFCFFLWRDRKCVLVGRDHVSSPWMLDKVIATLLRVFITNPLISSVNFLKMIEKYIAY